ncbi:hypothetical protein [Nostoc parmelioides]|uniref:Uncharacterized protein n=1 Tax=Nostoc parmelioides FACHB-3921 TaxID=2692909 RepID=A0ABR8BPZ8_9NOSO|nr:hypothetical protein [Nostoc parmelioides]MBD2255352.1 hypothetical protein [Nostoc parmelioides FACHB-3921]
MTFCLRLCDRLTCGYYRVSLHGEDLGDWSELGVLGVLSGLQHEFYRGRLVPSLAATTPQSPNNKFNRL